MERAGYSPSYIQAQSFPQGLSGMGFLMCGMRGQLGAHDEHDAEGMHFLNNVTDVMLGTSLRVYQASVGRKWPSVGNTHRAIMTQRTAGWQRTYITKLHHPDLSQFTDTAVGSFRLEEELSQRHLFTSEEFPHVAEGCERSAPLNQPEPIETEHW